MFTYVKKHSPYLNYSDRILGKEQLLRLLSIALKSNPLPFSGFLDLAFTGGTGFKQGLQVFKRWSETGLATLWGERLQVHAVTMTGSEIEELVWGTSE